jgi:hypothetical protein
VSVPDPPEVLQQATTLGSLDVEFVDGARQSEIDRIEDRTLADAVPPNDHHETRRYIEPDSVEEAPKPLHLNELKLHFSLLRRAATSFG